MEKHPEWSAQWWANFFKPELDQKGKSDPFIFHLLITGANLAYNKGRYNEDSNLRFLIPPKKIDKLLADIKSIQGPRINRMKAVGCWYCLIWT
jgi:hypothetical protein